MQPVYFFTNGTKVFGVDTEGSNPLPAFFTNRKAASIYGSRSIPDGDKPTWTFGRVAVATDLHSFIQFNEHSYVMLDGVPMTSAEMLKALNEEYEAN